MAPDCLIQLATGLITPPLEIISDLLFQSVLIFQIIAFLFSSFLVFISDILYVTYSAVDFMNDQQEE